MRCAQIPSKLDQSEDSSRRRMKLKPNYRFVQYFNERGAWADNSVGPETSEDIGGGNLAATIGLATELSGERSFNVPTKLIRVPEEVEISDAESDGDRVMEKDEAPDVAGLVEEPQRGGGELVDGGNDSHKVLRCSRLRPSKPPCS